MGSQAGKVDIYDAFHLYYKCCMWIEFQSISTWLRGFSPGTPVSSLLKIDSQSYPSGCGAVLRSHIWIERLTSSTAPSVRLRWAAPFAIQSTDCEKGWLAGLLLPRYINWSLRFHHQIVLLHEAQSVICCSNMVWFTRVSFAIIIRVKVMLQDICGLQG